jgi:Lsr2
MARQEIISDDLDGSPGAAPVTFGLEGRTYTIDLAAASLGRLRDALAPFIAAAHTQSSPGARGRRTSRPSNDRGYDLVELREWAAKKKIQVPARGRVPRAIVEQYQAAGGR